MKVTIITLFFVLVTIATIFVEAKPHGKMMPEDMPEDLKQEAEALHEQVKKWKSENQGTSWRDMPEEFKQKFEEIKTKYQEATNKEWPKRQGGPGGRGRTTAAP